MIKFVIRSGPKAECNFKDLTTEKYSLGVMEASIKALSISVFRKLKFSRRSAWFRGGEELGRAILSKANPSESTEFLLLASLPLLRAPEKALTVLHIEFMSELACREPQNLRNAERFFFRRNLETSFVTLK